MLRRGPPRAARLRQRHGGQGSPSAAVIRGHDEKRKVRNVRIENVTVGGKRVTGPEQNLLETGPFVEGATYK
ncbi:hypothetical protein [Pseudoduganella namucuonensis]|uniref:Uncharacterized protein n=1 Tax=Pseudoduganella namucuonensis TaxID=1035707 RepID=A0A1I7H6E9_9BURK|nr:hypothetical protein [Pseudoduganella namucuonensis]SFU56317.1 hypothetical protein SAMN05216552_100510 [Pseudoduganella namucuonensis]